MRFKTESTLLLCFLLVIGESAMPSKGEEPTSQPNSQATLEPGFEWLFDGRSLAGWEGDREWFSVKDRAIVAGKLDTPIPHNMFLCTTETFDNFELRLDAKLIGPGDNAGVQFRTRRIPNNHEVAGYQADMGRAWERSVWGALYDESRRRKMLAEPDPQAIDGVLKSEQWNAMRIRCEGPRVQIWINDLQTVDYTETDPQIESSGIIAVQIHGGKPAQASYRNVRIKRLNNDRNGKP